MPERLAAKGASDEFIEVQQAIVLSALEAPVIDLKTEWAKQAEQLAYLFARHLGMSREEYAATLPHFLPQPEAYRGRFDIPLIVSVHPKLGIGRIARIAGITQYFDVADRTKDWKDRPNGFATPRVPYTTWVDNGRRSLGVSVDAVRGDLGADERGGNIFDGIALYLKDPTLLERHNLDLPGSQVDPNYVHDYAPSLYLMNGKPKLYCRRTDDAAWRFGSVLAGKQINTKILAA